MATVVQDNVNNYYFKNQADFEAHKSEIPNNSTIHIEETGEINVEMNGTQTEETEDLINIVVEGKTYLVPANTTVETLVAQLNAMKLDLNSVKLGKQNELRDGDITTNLIADNAVTDAKLSTAIFNKLTNSLQKPASAPIVPEFVGIGTNNSQILVTPSSLDFEIEDNILYAKRSIMPNILTNGDFKFNQRLMTSYYGANAYGPDRWKVVDELAGISATNDASWEALLEDVETAGERIIISQRIETYKFLLDQDVTCHIEYKNLTEDVAGTTYFYLDDGVEIGMKVLDSTETSATFTQHINSTATKIEVGIKTSSTGLNTSLKIYYVKMEQGSSYTGKYATNYASELLKCQRFYQPVQVLGLTNIPTTTTTLQVSAPLINSLRTKPTATILFGSRMPSVTGNGATIACNGVTVQSFSNNSVILQFNVKSDMTLLQIYCITTSCLIALDSEIY